jgi:hypothetical protein
MGPRANDTHPRHAFEATVQAWDNYERLSASYRGTVAFTLESMI